MRGGEAERVKEALSFPRRKEKGLSRSEEKNKESRKVHYGMTKKERSPGGRRIRTNILSSRKTSQRGKRGG